MSQTRYYPYSLGFGDKAMRRERLRAARERGKHTQQEWTLLVALCGYGCLCCGRNDVPLTKDHIVPISDGGSDVIGNLQPLCQSCNSGKRDRTEDYRPDHVRLAAAGITMLRGG